MNRTTFLSSVAHRAFAPLLMSIDGVDDAISETVAEAVEEAVEEIREEIAEVQEEIAEAIADAVEEITEAVAAPLEETAEIEEKEIAAWHADLENLRQSILPKLESLTELVAGLTLLIPPPPSQDELTAEISEPETPPLNPETALDESAEGPRDQPIEKLVREIIVI